MKLLRVLLPFVVLAGYCIRPGATARADEIKISVADLTAEFDKDPKSAKDKYVGKQFQFETTLQKTDFAEDNK